MRAKLRWRRAARRAEPGRRARPRNECWPMRGGAASEKAARLGRPVCRAREMDHRPTGKKPDILDACEKIGVHDETR